MNKQISGKKKNDIKIKKNKQAYVQSLWHQKSSYQGSFGLVLNFNFIFCGINF